MDELAYLFSLEQFGIKFGLDNIRAILARLGHPERTFRSVHIAGTNGKGSVAKLLSAMMPDAGLYTSPHLVRLNERIQIGNNEICDDDLISILEEGAPEIPETYKLRSVEAMAGSSKTSWASVTLEKDGKIFSRTCQADGPVTAVCGSINFLTGFKGRLIDYAVHSVTPGADAISEVKAEIEFGDSVFTGRGASSDVIEASARAYLSAVNKAVVARNRQADRRPSGRVAFTGAAD